MDFFSSTTPATAFVGAVGTAVGTTYDNAYIVVATAIALGLFFWFAHGMKGLMPGGRGGRRS